jgi:hypothetical protein
MNNTSTRGIVHNEIGIGSMQIGAGRNGTLQRQCWLGPGLNSTLQSTSRRAPSTPLLHQVNLSLLEAHRRGGA